MSVFKANVDISDLFHDMSEKHQKSFLVEEFSSLPIHRKMVSFGLTTLIIVAVYA